jgi:transcriptional regulator with XRE-family HTH domain
MSKTLQHRLRFKEVRTQKGTQKKVAKDLDITETHLRELENGRSTPGTKLLIKMEFYFGISSKELFPDLYDPKFYLAS